MERIAVRGGRKLKGTVSISGAKNSALPIMAASLLTKEKVVLENVPWLGDVQIMIELMHRIGGKAEFRNGELTLYSNHLVPENLMHNGLATQIRYSTHFIGALLPRFKEVKLLLPGGCTIGARKLDSHILGLTKLGAKVEVNEDYIKASRTELEGSSIKLEYPSVGATENTLVAACMAKGQTVLENAACEPEVTDLADFLNAMGGRISGAGTSIVKIEGVNELNGTRFRIIPDRIETGTYIVASAITGGDILMTNVNLSLLESVVDKLREIGVKIEKAENDVRVTSPEKLNAVDIATGVYPGFPTDMQPIVTPLLSFADGESLIEETIFERRFNHVPELVKMGADMKIQGNKLHIFGKNLLHGADVNSVDIRAGGALVLAALAAQGGTTVDGATQIFRGYENLIGKLRNLGAEISS